MDKMLITLLVATIGGLAGYYLKIPAGAMIGAMIAVAAYNILGRPTYIPQGITIALQIVAGAMIGARITRDVVVGLKDMIIPGLIIIVGVVVLNFSIGLLIAKFGHMDLATSLFASAPGGLTDMTLIANDFGADTPKVAILQTLRLICVILLLPVLLKLFLLKFHIQR